MIKIIKILLVITCMISIFVFSNDPAYESDKKSNTIIVFIAETLAGHNLNKEERQEKIDKYVVLVRKTAHVIIYLILGFLIISLIKEYKLIDWKMMFLAFVLSYFYACSDEIHQLFVPGRSGNMIDVLIDSFGSYIGILIYHFYYRLRRKYE